MTGTEAFKARLRNLLVEFGVEPFCLVGFHDGADFEMTHADGDMKLRAINDLFKETYKANFEELDEYETEWWEEGEEWKE